MTYNSAEDISYTPEKAVEWSAQAAQDVEDYVRKLDIRSKRRSKDVWLRDIEKFKTQTLPRTLIAVCGTTGAGKSSLINALLGDNIVPTSSMRACTAVATEVSYHEKNTIEAKIEFVTRDEWRHELEALVHDLKTKKGKDTDSLWHKIHAVYPKLTVKDFASMSPDDIIGSNQKVSEMLGTFDEVESPDSAHFSSKIARYIDSPKRIVVATAAGEDSPETLWPLIRVVRVLVKAETLKSGATLVDLPGLGDANLARCNVANEYIKKCDYIWIVSDIKRAVDESVAQKLQDDFFKAQIMSEYSLLEKPTPWDIHDGLATVLIIFWQWSDHLDPDEVIQAMNLESLPELVDLERQIDRANNEKAEHDAIAKEARTAAQKTTIQIAELESDISKYKTRLSPAIIKTEQPSEPLVSQNTTYLDSRKRQHESDSHTMIKRVRTNAELVAANHDESDHPMDVDTPDIQDDTRNSATQGTWKRLIDWKEGTLANSNEQLQHLHRTRLEAEAQLNECQQAVNKLEKLKYALCSKKRNEYVKSVAMEDFKVGLEQFEQHEDSDDEGEGEEIAVADKRSLARDTTGLTAFTCSSRDYIRIQGTYGRRTGRNMEPTCYTNIEDTEVPKLQRWCHTLATNPRQKLAHSLLQEMLASFSTVASAADTVEDRGVSITDCLKLSKLWESDLHAKRTNDPLRLVKDELPEPDPEPEIVRKGRKRREITVRSDSPETRLSDIADEARELLGARSHRLHHDPQVHKGVAAQLHPKLRLAATDCVQHLRKAFQRIRRSCDTGVNQAVEAALETSDRCVKNLHHPTHQAIIRRDGEWRAINWNAELAKPLSQAIAIPWARVFHPDRDLFSVTSRVAKDHINGLLADLVESAPNCLKPQCKSRCGSASEEAELIIDNTLQKLKLVIEVEQKSISRCLVPTTRAELRPAYQLALQEQGKGSFARRKQIIRDHIENNADTIFGACSATLFDKLDEAAKSIGDLLEISFSNLSEKVEANVSTLWDIPSENKASISHLIELAQRARSFHVQLGYWLTASEKWEASRQSDPGRGN